MHFSASSATEAQSLETTPPPAARKRILENLTEEEEEELLTRAAERAERKFRESVAAEKRKAALNGEAAAPEEGTESDRASLLEALRIVKRRRPSPVAVDLEERFAAAAAEQGEGAECIPSQSPPTVDVVVASSSTATDDNDNPPNNSNSNTQEL